MQTQKGLSIGQMAGWGLADMGIVVFVIVKQLLVLAFLTNYLGVPIVTAGMLTTLVLIFDIISDPLIGYLSDKTHSRFGRRAPWIALGALVLAGGMIGIFGVPLGMGPTGNFAWVAAFFVIATIGFTMVVIPYGAMAGEMTQDPHERSKMTGVRLAFASIGILIGGAVIPQLAGDSREGYFTAALVVTPIMVAAIWIALLATRNAPRIDNPNQQSFLKIVSTVFENKAFMVLVVLYGVMTLAVAMITAGLPFAAIYLLIDDGTTALSGVAKALSVLSLMFAAFVLGALLSQVIWVVLSGRFGKVSALIFGLCLYVVLLAFLYSQLPSVNVTAMAGLFVLAGITNGSYQQIPWAIYPDLMDVTRERTGLAIEGAFSAVWLFGQKLANALAPLILSLILGAYGWLETTEGKVEQSPEAIEALRLSISIIPAGVLVLAIIGLKFVYQPTVKRL